MDARARKKELLAAVCAADAYGEIGNTMGRASVAYMFHQPEKIKALFALDDGSALQFPGHASAVGAEEVSAAIDALAGAPLQPGEMTDCHLCSPRIEISEDNRGAEGSWEIISAIGVPTPDASEKARAEWAFGSLTASFVYDGENWRIHKLCYERKTRCLYDRGWAGEVSA